ncbi:MAG: alpha/beta hydrolase, partial [Myxococcaceae bacterium]
HRRVFVCGLSMGALLAVLLAARHAGEVSGLALLAPALRFRGPTMALLRAVRRLPVLELARPWVRKTGIDIEDEAERAAAPVLPAFPSVRLRDVFELQDAVRSALPRVTAPTLIAVAARDHVVSAGGGRELARGLVNARPVRFIRLLEGSHQMARDKGRATLAAEVCGFFTRP